MSAEVDALPDMLARLKLVTMRDKLDGLLDEAARGDLSLREALALLCRAEVSHREERRIQMGTSLAKFPCQRTLEAFDFAPSAAIPATASPEPLAAPPSPRSTPGWRATCPRAAGWPTATPC